MKFNRESKKLDASEGIKGFVPWKRKTSRICFTI